MLKIDPDPADDWRAMRGGIDSAWFPPDLLAAPIL
jgi:hypothetical protein